MVSERALKNVVFAGLVEKPEELLGECDVFVLPSLSEGLPIAMLEAMASRKPCVVTDIGLPVEDGKTALVVKSGDAKALASAVNELLSNGTLAKKIASNGFKHVKKNFSWPNAIKKIVCLARELKGGERKSSAGGERLV
jgi:glycosyltransferase involved in cell wall biosynthesis